MRRVIDTSILIDHLRGVDAARDLLLGAIRDGHELWSVTVVRTEVLAGMRPAEERPTRALLGVLRWLDVNIDLADRAGTLAARFMRSHRGIDTVDYLIAAATEQLGARLDTLNVRHFPMFAGLVPSYRDA